MARDERKSSNYAAREKQNLSPEIVYLALLGFRLVNAFTLATFFQPDEYYQALEPAWQMAFGKKSGAWITWEWHHQLRSALHPFSISIVYSLVSGFSLLVDTSLKHRSALLLLIPKLFQAVVAASLDFCIWQLGNRFHRGNKTESIALLALIIFSPWQWFVSTRSFVNGVEALFTTAALIYWPWSWRDDGKNFAMRQSETQRFKYCIILSGIGIMLRPTNAIIWGILCIFTLPYATQEEFFNFVSQSSLYGSVVLVLSSCIDRLYYGFWVIPAFKFFEYNLSQDLAVFYGRNRTDYYITEGLPTLLTFALPFAILGIFRAFGSPITCPHKRLLAITSICYVGILSGISHKEARFLYPLIGPLLVLAVRPFNDLFAPFPRPYSLWRKMLLYLLGLSSIVLAFYTAHVHNRGIVPSLDYLRTEFEAANPELMASKISQLTNFTLLPDSAENITVNGTDVAFLMPCHSTPWRSHLIHNHIKAWALTCEPPIGLTGQNRLTYKDEADIFYDDPILWMKSNLEPVPSTRRLPASTSKNMLQTIRDSGREYGDSFVADRRPWPQYVVFFEQLQSSIVSILGGEDSLYRECWRTFNSHWHDDWRRRGDIIVWCAIGHSDAVTAKSRAS